MTRARIDCPECGGPLALEMYRASTGELMCPSCLAFVASPDDVRAAAQALYDKLPKEPYLGPICEDCGVPANPIIWVACGDGNNRDLCEACAAKRNAEP